MPKSCQALYLSDGRRCEKAADSSNGLFCVFHAHQCRGLYMGYKRRNAQLDQSIANPPPLLKDTPVHELQPETVDDEVALKECYDHLSNRYALLERVIRARRLHTSRFYALELDYGHENYVNQLNAQRTPLLRAIERVVKRLAEVIYEKQKWFDWVRKLEDEEEKERDVEKKKLKQEAAMFRRHLKDIEQRQQRIRAEEDAKQQAEFLEKAWSEVQTDSQAGTDDEEWDPIEDNIEEERGNYITLLRHFLWQQVPADGKVEDVVVTDEKNNVKPGGSDAAETPERVEDTNQPLDTEGSAAKSKNAKKKARQKAKTKAGATDQVKAEDKDQVKPGTVHVESMAEMRERLRVGQEYKNGGGWHWGNKPPKDGQYETRSPPLKPAEIDQLLSDTTEIKQLIFCRLVLAHATLLPIALHSSSIDEFLANDQVSGPDLRDLCLKMEQPELQVIRDACADLKREEDDIDDDDNGDPHSGGAVQQKKKSRWQFRHRIPQTYETDREKKIKEKREPAIQDEPGELVKFGIIDDQSQYQFQKIKVKVCGKVIYNYPSEKAMSRGGWFQFAIIAKDCGLEDAAALCRSWDEFHELVILTLHHYFPTGSWASFLGSQDNQQLFRLGFFPYFTFEQAEGLTHRRQTGRHQPGPRQHEMLEVRNFICGQMKRNDPVTRRFIQHIALQTCQMVMFVRDVKTGSVLVEPPEEELWLSREKAGLGRANKYEWNELEAVGEDFFEKMDKYRQWSLNFKDYYEIIIWDLEPGNSWATLFNAVSATLFKALRVRNGAELYQQSEKILKAITFDNEIGRTYDIQPGEDAMSMWDALQDEATRKTLLHKGADKNEVYHDFPKEWAYNDIDEIEDAVLFASEEPDAPALSSKPGSSMIDKSNVKSENYTRETVILAQKRRMHAFEHSAPDMNRFILNLDTDDEMDEDEMEAEVERLENASPQNEHKNHKRETYKAENSDEQVALTGDQLTAFRKMVKARNRWLASGEESDMDDSSDEEPIESRLTMRQMRELQTITENAMKSEVEGDFLEFVDRERAVVFKEAWHRADLEPNAQQQWGTYQSLLADLTLLVSDVPQDTTLKIEKWRLLEYAYNLLTVLEIEPDCAKRTIKDAKTACAFISLFFDTSGTTLLSDDKFAKYQDSMLFAQRQRASTLPDRRSRMSNKTRPREHFKELDRLRDSRGKCPEEWDRVLRPIIALLYREGIVCTSYHPGAAGRVFCFAEPGRPNQPDLYFDWRQNMSSITMSQTNPMDIDLFDQARTFASTNTDARFSVLRIWSAPHFWPLMLGVDNRDFTSFVDGIGRNWEWKFIPKDMPYSEWSMHKTLSDRLRAFPYFSNQVFSRGSKVVHRIDTVLVMAKDIESCRFLTTAATFAINTNPWRFELDPWKSFINMDFPFLSTMDKKWWD